MAFGAMPFSPLKFGGKILTRTILTAGGTTLATGAYYANKMKEWGEDTRDRLIGFLQGVDLSTGFDLSGSVPFSGNGGEPSPSGGVNPVFADASGGNDKNDGKDELNLGRGKDFVALTRQLIEVRNILKTVDKQSTILSLPSIVVIGSQSSGKSSLLESLIGHDILPKGSNMVTRRPVEITLINTASDSTSGDGVKEYAEFPRQGLYKIQDFSRIKEIVSELNDSVSVEECISDDPIDLRIYSPHVPDLTLIDLPGYIAVNNRNQPPLLKQKIVTVCRKYIQEPNIILAVCAADVDLANSEALNESRQVDPYGVRTIGAITKMDLVDPEKGVDLIKNDSYALQLGYFGVICKAQGKTSKCELEKYQQILTTEEGYYRSRADVFTPIAPMLGIPALRTSMIKVLEEHLTRSLKHIVSAVRSELEEARYQFKVQFNDQVISSEAYTTEVLDKIKLNFRNLAQEYNRTALRQELQSVLDSRVIEICSEIYWDKVIASDVAETPTAAQAKLNAAQSQLTKGGIGRMCTQKIVDTLSHAVNETVLGQHPITYHLEAQKKLKELAGDMLRSKMYATVDQVENVLKPFKYDVDFTEAEWNDAMQHARQCLDNELKKSQDHFKDIRDTVGWKKLRNAMQYLEKSAAEKKPAVLVTTTDTPQKPAPEQQQFGPKILAKAQEALLLQKRMKTLQERIYELQPYSFWWGNWYPRCSATAVLKSTSTASPNSPTAPTDCIAQQCPEPYLFLIAQKMSQIAVTFIWIELLTDMFYQYPREVDNRMYYQLDKQQLERFANENPQISSHLALQEKKHALERAMEKLMLIYLFQNNNNNSKDPSR